MMIARRTFLLCGAILLLAHASTSMADTSTPLDIVHSIYKGGNTTGRTFGLDPQERQQFFSKSTATLWDKAEAITNPTGEEVGAIDFDITTNSQGADVKSYTITSNKIDGKAATVVVKLVLDNWLRNSPDEDIIRYEFVLEDGRWTINDVGSHIDSKPWTLLGLLEINSRDRTRSKE